MYIDSWGAAVSHRGLSLALRDGQEAEWRGRRKVQERGVCAHRWLIVLLYSRYQHDTVKQLHSNKKKKGKEFCGELTVTAASSVNVLKASERRT